MGRTARDKRPYVPPVQKIELNARHTKLRLALALILFALGVSLIVFSLNSRSSVEAGWAEIEAETSGDASCAADFTFLYPLGTTASPAAERGALVRLYSEACVDAYRLFSNDAEFDGVVNVRSLNLRPNEGIAVDAALYRAFERVAESGDRSLYLAPVYEIYSGVFHCEDASQTAEFDPRQNGELCAWCESVCAYVNDPAQVNLELLGGNRVRLRVSDEYLAFARSEEIESFIDFYWMKNAFIADELAERLTASGYSIGTLSSCDGFARNLDAAGETDYALNLYDRVGATVYPAAVMRYRGARAIVSLRGYPGDPSDGRYYRALPGGEMRTPHLDARDGLCRDAINDLTAYSTDAGCAEILLKLIPVYIADEFDAAALDDLAREGVYSVYCENAAIHHTEDALSLTQLYAGEDVQYQIAP